MTRAAPLVEGVDYYVDPEGLWVFTAAYLKRRGFCCHQGCRHCPYEVTPRLRASPLVVHDGALLAIRLKDPEDGRILLFPPGGGIEAGETAVQAAEREALEETGYTVVADPAAHLCVQYPFRWGGREYDCTTHFFTARLKDPSAPPLPRAPQEVEFLISVEWIPLEDLNQAFGHHGILVQTIASLIRS